MREAPGNGAASVASQLRAFLRDPAQFRPRLLRGKDPLPDGAHLLRFAQGRFPRNILRDLAAVERDEVRDAANAFIRQVCFWDAATHYQVLCASADAPAEDIREHYHLVMGLIHPDRQDAAFEPWPTGCAQRANHAYSVLSDPAQRREYDASLQRIAAASTYPPRAPEPPSERRQARRPGGRARLAKALVVVVAIVATLLLLEALLVDSSDRSFLAGTFSARGPRNVASAEHPRFIGSDAASSRERPSDASAEALRAEGFPFFDPLWRALGPTPAEVPTAPMPAAAPRRVSSVDALAPPPRAAAPQPSEAAVSEVARNEKAEVLAQAPAVAKAQPAPKAQAPAKSAEGTVKTQDIELLVARLVGYYEAGETENLMGLIDLQGASFWQTARTRQAYQDFFRATRLRKLRVNNLAWESNERLAQAKGEATVVAEYFDTPGMLERRVAVEMDFALRDGTPKITRLLLFPDVR